MARVFAPHGGSEQEREIGIGAIVSHDVSYSFFLVGEKAVPDGPVRRKPEAVACATEGFRDARDEPYLADTVGKAEPLGRCSICDVGRAHWPTRRDAIEDLSARY